MDNSYLYLKMDCCAQLELERTWVVYELLSQQKSLLTRFTFRMWYPQPGTGTVPLMTYYVVYLPSM